MSANDSIRLFSVDRNGLPACGTVGEVVAAYLESRTFDLHAGSIKPRSVEKAQHYLSSFAEHFGTRRVDACHRNDLVTWLVDHKEWQSTFTRVDAVGSVITCFRWAAGELKISNPFTRPKYLGPPLQPRPAIKPEEYQAIRLQARRALTTRGRRCRTREPFRVGLCFLWKTGCRTCEMRCALWDQLDWDRAVVVQDDHKTVKVTGEPRIIPVRSLLPLLRWLFRRRRRGQRYIFVNSLGKPWTCDRFAKEFRRYARYAGVRDEISAYCLRHGLTVRLIEEGRTERQIADVLGQKSTRFVAWYGKSTRSAADYLNEILRPRRKR